VGLTFVNYELMAGPLLLTAFFLAPDPDVRPLTPRARVAFAMLVGALAAAGQLYVSVSTGPYLALLVAGFLVPTLDRRLIQRPLV